MYDSEESPVTRVTLMSGEEHVVGAHQCTKIVRISRNSPSGTIPYLLVLYEGAVVEVPLHNTQSVTYTTPREEASQPGGRTQAGS